MNANDFQKQAARTLIDQPDFRVSKFDWRRVINAIALSVTAGAIVEHYKKSIFHQHGNSDLQVKVFLPEIHGVCFQFFTKQCIQTRPGFTNMNMVIVWNLVGLLGEAAEIGQLILEGLTKGEFDKAKLAKELGDALWYISALCSKLGLDLGEVMAANIRKLEERYPNGYTASDSRARRDTDEYNSDHNII